MELCLVRKEKLLKFSFGEKRIYEYVDSYFSEYKYLNRQYKVTYKEKSEDWLISSKHEEFISIDKDIQTIKEIEGRI